MVTLSYSAIKLLRTDPAKYEKIYIHHLPRDRETGPQVEGLYLNDLLLKKETLKDKFIVIPEIPSSDMMLTFIDELAKLVNGHIAINEGIQNEDILKYEVDAWSKSGYTEALASVREKAKKYEKYFQYCLVKESKIGISLDQVKKVENIAQECDAFLNEHLNLRAQKKELKSAQEGLLKGFTRDDVKGEIDSAGESYWEFPFITELTHNSKITGKRSTIRVRGAMDYVFVSHFGKRVWITDLKKVKNLLEFKNEYKDRFLDIQAGVYVKAMQEYLKSIKSDYAVCFCFVVVDDESRHYRFGLKETSIKECVKTAEEETDKALWHIIKNRYSLPYEYLTEEIKL